MKKFRQRILEMKEGFLDAKCETSQDAFTFANTVFIASIVLVLLCISFVFIPLGAGYISIGIEVVILIVLWIPKIYYKICSICMPYSSMILLHFFGRYGRVVTMEDWKRIKKLCPKEYKKMISKKSNGYCYFYSWAIAYFLKDAELMYCSITLKDGRETGHSVIVKNNCVYDTNSRLHYDLEEYKKFYGVQVFKMFSVKEYGCIEFFDNIRDDFKKWCADRNVYCAPQ